MEEGLSPSLLVCAATRKELETFGTTEGWRDLTANVQVTANGETLRVVSGVGIPCTLGSLLPVVQRWRPALILNIGIAGAYPGSGLALGDIVMGDSEVYGDVGFELPEEPRFRAVSEAPFGRFYAEPFPLTLAPRFCRDVTGIRRHTARGCTVNACTGTDATGHLRARLFQAGFESMEGAAVAQVGKQEGIPVCEVRAISNLAARRDMRPENIALALHTLRAYLSPSTFPLLEEERSRVRT